MGVVNNHVTLPFDEALTKTGNGRYNYLLAATCSLILLSICIDLFGFSLIVTAACDLNITVVEKGILTSLPFAGIILTSYMWGVISDTFGRKHSLKISLIMGFVLSSLSSLSPNWIVLGALKFLDVCFFCAANSITYTLMGESCVERVRSKFMLVMTVFLIWGSAASAILTYPTLSLDFAVDVPWLGIVFKPWRLLILVHAIPSGISAVAILFFHESPKFLFYQGRAKEALNVMKSIYAVNHGCSKDEFGVDALTEVQATVTKEKKSLVRTILEQSAPMFRPPLLIRTIQLFFIVFVVYITNNSFLVFQPIILNLMKTSSGVTGNICALLRANQDGQSSDALSFNSTNVTNTIEVEACDGTVKLNTIITLVISQTVYASLTFILAWFPNQRKFLMIFIICVSACSGILTTLMTDLLASVFFFLSFSCTCLAMGILSSYFVEMYPTSCRGMASCLSIMVGRTSGFIGINIVANCLFNYCEVTFYVWSILVLSSAVVSWYLPADKKV